MSDYENIGPIIQLKVTLTNRVCSPSVKCVALAHHALAHDWYNISLVTIANAEWCVRSALCGIDFSQQANVTGSCMLFVKGNFHWIIAFVILLYFVVDLFVYSLHL